LFPSTSSGPAFRVKFFEDGKDKPATVSGAGSVVQPVAPISAVNTSGSQSTTRFSLTAKPPLISPSSASKALPAVSPVVTEANDAHVFNSISSNEALSHHPEIPKAALQQATAHSKTCPIVSPELAAALGASNQGLYTELIVRTLDSLFHEIKTSCAKNNAHVAVIALPSRAQLCPHSGLERTFANMDYSQEIAIVSSVCHQNNIGFFDCESAAEQLPMNFRDEMYYTVHLTPNGQNFIADSVQPFVKAQLELPALKSQSGQ
jgi:hypothetical protein